MTLEERVDSLEGRIPEDLDKRLRDVEKNTCLVLDGIKRIEGNSDPNVRRSTCPQNELMVRIDSRLDKGNELFGDIAVWQKEHDVLHKDREGLGGVMPRVDTLERDFKRFMTVSKWVGVIFATYLLQRVVPSVWESIAKAIIGS